MLPIFRIIAALSISALLAVSSLAAPIPGYEEKAAVNPLRLSYISGKVSFWRYGAEDWVEARINTPLANGDALYVGKDAALELQAESRAFIRADDDTQLTLVNQSPDFLQLKVTSGRMSLDLRTLPTSGYNIEVDTPNAVFAIDHAGYYRVDVDDDVHFITRRGGRATLTPAGGEAMSVQPSEEIVVQGTDVARAETYVAPELDSWDRWNFDRTNDLVDAVSERYLPSGVAGGRDLDHYGNWRVMSDYGPVWVPDAVPYGWAPYSAGHWIWDPYYQWTWIDDAPWGWAPFHYGRWVYLDGYWAWAPGTVVVRRPVYAPALVAFFGVTPHTSVSIGIGTGVGWVALGWGEPVMPWWGSPAFVGRPWWGGWGGPRIVNNVVVRQTTVVNVTNITYVNSRVSNAVIATPAERFGRGQANLAPLRLQAQDRALAQIRGALPVKPSAASLVADAPKALAPPEQVWSRPVVATRHPQEAKLPWRSTAPAPTAVEPRYVLAPKPAATDLRRPEFGTQTGPERERPPLPPRYEKRERPAEAAPPPAVGREQPRESAKPESRAIRIAPEQTMAPPRPVSRVAPGLTEERAARERPVPAARMEQAMPQEMRPPREHAERAEREGLPGKAANRIYRGHGQGQGSAQDKSEQR